MVLSTDLVGAMEYNDIFGAIEIVARAGFDACDFPFNYVYGLENNPILNGDYKAYAKKTLSHAKRCGIYFNQAHAPLPTYDFNADKEKNDKKYLAIIRSIEMCEIMNIPRLVIHPVDCYGQNVDEFEYNIKLFESFIPYLKKHGVKLAIENIYRVKDKATGEKDITPTDSPELLKKYIDALPSEYFTVCLDLGHAFVTGYKPEDFMRALKKGSITALHVHDASGNIDRHNLPFLGDNDWQGIINGLKEIEYDGDFTYENWRFDRFFPNDLLIDSLKFKERLGRWFIKQIKG